MADESDQHTITIRLRSAPFAHDPPFMPQLYQLMGQVVILWSRLESQIDTLQLLTLQIAQRFDKNINFQNSFSGKLDAIHAALVNSPPLRSQADYFMELARNLRQVAHDRNVVIHSPVSEILEATETIKLSNRRFTKDMLHFRTFEINAANLSGLLTEIDDLKTAILPLSFQISAVHREILQH